MTPEEEANAALEELREAWNAWMRGDFHKAATLCRPMEHVDTWPLVGTEATVIRFPIERTRRPKGEHSLDR